MSDDDDERGAPEERETFTIDELAAETRVPSRTIRFYQSKGALMPPEIRGRVAHYRPEHVARLELIGQLKDRGLRIRAIRDLVERMDAGELDIGEWLGLEDRLKAPWADDSPQVLSGEALDEKLGDAPAGLRSELLRLGLVERKGGSFLVPSPGLLEVTLGLERAGVDLEVAVAAGDIVEKHVRKMTGELVGHFKALIGEGFGRDPSPKGIERAYDALRPLGLEALRLIFGREMQRALRELVESGEAVRAGEKKRRKGRRRKRSSGGADDGAA